MVLCQNRAVVGGAGSVWSGTGWFLVILGQYGALLVGTWWYWISIERLEIWSGVTIAGQRTNKRTRKDRATQPLGHGRMR